MIKTAAAPLFDPALVGPAIVDAFKKLTRITVAQSGDVRRLHRQHPHDSCCSSQALGGQGEAPAGFILSITLWLWFTVLFANFAEALAEGRSKAQAASLRGAEKKGAGQETGTPRDGASCTDRHPAPAQGRCRCWSKPVTRFRPMAK